MKIIFITRNLKATDFFKTALEKVGFSVVGNSLIEFSKIEFISIPDCDWLFFYSKNAVSFFLQQLDLTSIQSKKIATIGHSTAEFIINNYNLKVDFIGTGEPLQTAKAFVKIAANQTILFPRAATSKQSIQKQLGNTIIQKDLIVYQNQPKTNFEIIKADILVFTSPMNVQTYFGKTNLKEGQKVIAIGNTTANELLKLGIKNIIIANEPSKKGLIKAILSMKY